MASFKILFYKFKRDVVEQSGDNNKQFKEKLEEFKTTNYCSLDEFNLSAVQAENAIDYVELTNEDNVDKITSHRSETPPSPLPPPPPIPKSEKTKNSSKKQPPPVMKKPEKSEEILRKLGRGGESLQQQFGTISSISSTSSSIQDRASTSSNSNTENNNNVTIRLSHSKATDV